ncbi:hypothetical protein ElyMa_006152000 [Elysia marginata]|uniref:Uncharacterized protein n=1 Tax=Elysia marginata TaxID=1093978 RepID=A0AAV4GZ52_9GAST|nr:hypothetical protein ElyMa_006152000 [Elysia marginata]
MTARWKKQQTRREVGRPGLKKKRRKDKKATKPINLTKKMKGRLKSKLQMSEKHLKKDRRNANKQKGAQDRGRSTNISHGDITRYLDQARSVSSKRSQPRLSHERLRNADTKMKVKR